MKYEWIDDFLLSKKGIRTDYKEEWCWRRYMIEDKMFAAVCFDDNHKEVFITLKLEPMEGVLMRNQYEDIIPGYYMNKEHWNSVKADGYVPEDLLKDMLDKSYGLILKSFSKKKQAEILAQ